MLMPKPKGDLNKQRDELCPPIERLNKDVNFLQIDL